MGVLPEAEVLGYLGPRLREAPLLGGRLHQVLQEGAVVDEVSFLEPDRPESGILGLVDLIQLHDVGDAHADAAGRRIEERLGGPLHQLEGQSLGEALPGLQLSQELPLLV